MISGKTSYPAQAVKCLFCSAGFNEPSWRLNLEEHENDQESARNELQRKWDASLRAGSWRNMSIDSIVHPEADDLRELQTAFEEANETAANRRWCTFGNVDRNDQRGSAHCKAYKRS
jgi:hypothetical protein